MNQEIPAEVETRANQDFESDEEMTPETEETDDISEPNNEQLFGLCKYGNKFGVSKEAC